MSKVYRISNMQNKTLALFEFVEMPTEDDIQDILEGFFEFWHDADGWQRIHNGEEGVQEMHLDL